MARFSLAQLLTFVLGCCVHLAALRSLFISAPTEIPLTFSIAVAQIGAWLALSVLYWYWRLPYVMGVHSAFVAVFALFVGTLMLDEPFSQVRVFQPMSAGCALGTIISFPIAIATILYRGIRKHNPTMSNRRSFSIRMLLTLLAVMTLLAVALTLAVVQSGAPQ